MDILQRASKILSPFMDEDRRNTWLTLAFHSQHRDIYDAIKQEGATLDFVPRCVGILLDRGSLGERHALSLLLEAVRKQAGDEKQVEFEELIAELDATCERPLDANCPYRDLRAFQEEDAPFFFGREAFTKELVEAVDRRPFVAVVGPSGSGKSSVVQAGLIPVLRSRSTWVMGILRPGAEPWRSLAGCLLRLLQGEAAANERLKRLDEIGRLAGNLSHPEPGAGHIDLKHVVEAILAAHPGSARLLLVVDQWEELYTYKQTDAATAARFTDVLIEAALNAPLTVVLTLRADFTGRALEHHRPLRDRLQEATVFLGDMTREEREQAIVGPARRANLNFEPGLVNRILDDVANEPGHLPLLEFCLTQLYARSREGRMSQAAYDVIGGVKGAIVQRANNVIDELKKRDPDRESLARDVFLQLVHLGEGSENTRRRALLSEFDEPARSVITDLATARLLVTARDPGSEKETVEVAHEALIRNWPRLRDWLKQDRDDLHVRREIERAAGAWTAHGEAYRWSDERVILETAPALRRLGSRFALNEAERRFLGPIEADEMLRLLQDPTTTHAQRAIIGDRLALLPGGDPRAGVGLRPDKVPNIRWHAIPGGEVELEISAGSVWSRLRGRPRFRVERFHIARYPVTVAQWRPFVDAEDGYDARVRRVRGWEPDPQRGRANQPAVMVTWVEAMAYCEWISERVGHEVRLPTEWEWQQAATGGDPENEYPWGAWQEGRANTDESALGRVTAVGLYPDGASAQRVMDFAGNVWEWCLNKYDSPKDTTPGGDDGRVVRGGSWDNGRDYARCAFRNPTLPRTTATPTSASGLCVSPPSFDLLVTESLITGISDSLVFCTPRSGVRFSWARSALARKFGADDPLFRWDRSSPSLALRTTPAARFPLPFPGE